jgi:hypothetical protein
MRDGQIFAMHQSAAKRDGLLLAQFHFLKTRELAATNLIKFSTLKQRLTWLLNPLSFLDALDGEQKKLLAVAAEQMQTATEKSKIKIVKSL